jgi:hypothetical protein
VGVLGAATRLGKGRNGERRRAQVGGWRPVGPGVPLPFDFCVNLVSLQENVSLSNQVRSQAIRLRQVVRKRLEEAHDLPALSKRAGLDHMEDLFLPRKLISGAMFT